MPIRKPGAPRRLIQLNNGSKTKVINRIRPDRLEKVEAHVNKSLPMSASDAEVTNVLLIYEENHPEDFLCAPYHDGHDIEKMSNLQKHEYANRVAPKKPTVDE